MTEFNLSGKSVIKEGSMLDWYSEVSVKEFIRLLKEEISKDYVGILLRDLNDKINKLVGDKLK